MFILYIAVFVVLAAAGSTVGYVVARSSDKVAQLAAPPSVKQLERAEEMKRRYKKAVEIYEFLSDRFNTDFNHPENDVVGIQVISNELLAIKKQLVCVNFKLQAHNQHVDPKFCKELAKQFDDELLKLNTQLENLSRIWSDV